MDDATLAHGVQASPEVATALERQLEAFFAPLVVWLDARLDRRLVRTFISGIVALVEWRNRAHGLLLSELGAYVLDPAHAPAGTKRLSNLLRSAKWAASDLTDWLWQHADRQVQRLTAAGEEALLVWDSSVLEKPESLASPDLGSVRSSKGKRLTHIKPGFYHPPSRPIFVPGWQWLGLLVLGRRAGSAPPTVAHMRWWTNRGPHASDRRTEEGELLRQCAQRWGQRVCHVWDRGFAATPWLDEVLARHLRFVLRWPGRYKLLGARTGEHALKAWQPRRGNSCAGSAVGTIACCGMRGGTVSAAPACWPCPSGAPTTAPMPGRCGSSSPAAAAVRSRGTCSPARRSARSRRRGRSSTRMPAAGRSR